MCPSISVVTTITYSIYIMMTDPPIRWVLLNVIYPNVISKVVVVVLLLVLLQLLLLTECLLHYGDKETLTY